MTLTDQHRQYLAGYLSNMSVVLVGLALTDQPIMGRPITWLVRWCIIGLGLGLLVSGLAIDAGREEGSHD